MVLYPSVTVCKKFTFDTYLDSIFDKIPINLTEVKGLAIANSWDIENVFYFLSHPHMLGLSFPCTTQTDGTDPGKPCVFPFKDYEYDYDNNDYYYEYEDGCFSMETTSPACFTRLTVNKTNYKLGNSQEFWGYCPENCKGEKINPDCEYNLAKANFFILWESEFYDLRE